MGGLDPPAGTRAERLTGRVSYHRKSEENGVASNAEMKAAFDRLASAWTNSEKDDAVREEITGMIGPRRNSVIADIGCGKGVMLGHLLKTHPSRIYAVDISGEMIRCARELHRDMRITFVNDDILNASLPLLDAAVIFNAYPHLTDKRALTEKLSGVVRRGGCVVIAHSHGRKKINGVHERKRMEAISVPLRPAQVEAMEFAPQFAPDIMVDREDIFLLRMIRR